MRVTKIIVDLHVTDLEPEHLELAAGGPSRRRRRAGHPSGALAATRARLGLPRHRARQVMDWRYSPGGCGGGSSSKGAPGSRYNKGYVVTGSRRRATTPCSRYTDSPETPVREMGSFRLG